MVDKPLTVLIVEGEQEECRAFIRYIDSVENVRLVGITNNDKKAVEYVKDHLPDAVILDLELHKGSGNGITFLTTLDKMRSMYSPYILVTTHNISRITHEHVRQLGVDFVIVKSQEDYSAKTVVDFLRALKKTIQDSQKKMRNEIGLSEDSPAEMKQRLTARVTTEIDQIGISPKALGRGYLIDAIIFRIEGRAQLIAAVAQKYSKSDASVERAMQNAINKAWNTVHPDDLMLHYTSRIHPEKGVPTLIEFIYHYANKLVIEY